MKTNLVKCAIAAALLTVSAGASAAGCVKGGAIGAVGGHFAGKHGVAGAVAGCAVGHHLAKKKAEQQQVAAQQAAAPQANTTATQPVATKKHFWSRKT